MAGLGSCHVLTLHGRAGAHMRDRRASQFEFEMLFFKTVGHQNDKMRPLYVEVLLGLLPPFLRPGGWW